MATGDRIDPFRGYNFRVEIDNLPNLSFRECSGLTLDVAPVEYREGTDKFLHVRKLTGLRTSANIQCKHGIVTDRRLWLWYLEVLNGNPKRRDGSVILTDEAHADQWRWHFYEGWICKWEGPSFNATANQVAVEAIEICVERVEVVPG
jgi:phage tail-like protein